MRKLIIALIILPSLFLHAQNGSIRGKVVTDENEPLIGANIIVSGSQFGTATQKDGSFEIKNLPFGEYTLEVSMIDYSKKIINYSLDASSTSITIILTEQLIQTQQIIVSA